MRMRIKLNWTQGNNLGLAFLYLGLSGFVQVLLIAIGQYGYSIGSRYVVTLIPFGATLALAYASSAAFEASLNKQIYISLKSNLDSGTLTKEDYKQMLKPFLLMAGIFLGLFFLAYYMSVEAYSSQAAFVVGANVGSIGVLLVSDRMQN